MIVPEALTVISPTEALDALWHAHQDEIGGPCPVALLEILGAQWCVETARDKAMHNYNMGNLRGSGDAGTFSQKGATEIVDGKEIEMPDGFAAFSSARVGAIAMIRYLGVATKPPAPNRFQAAWDAACRGDAATYCAEIRAHGYFTADLGLYTKALIVHRDWLRAGPLPDFLRSLAP